MILRLRISERGRSITTMAAMMMMEHGGQSPSKLDILGLYRRLLRQGRVWKARDPSKTLEEQTSIENEIKQRFREHRDDTVMPSSRIRELLNEGEERMQLALHYGIPYERLKHVPTMGGVVINKQSRRRRVS